MGNYYYIYLEAKVGGKWKCIDGYGYRKRYDKDEEELNLMSLYENGSYSYFGETYSKLREIGNSTLFTDLSDDIQKEFPDFKFDINVFGDEKRIASYITIPVHTFKQYVPKNFEYHGIVHKDAIASYENDEYEEPYVDDELDFNKMSDLEKMCYQYYEWDSVFGWNYYFKKLNNMIDVEIQKFYNFNLLCEDSTEFRLVVFCV